MTDKCIPASNIVFAITVTNTFGWLIRI